MACVDKVLVVLGSAWHSGMHNHRTVQNPQEDRYVVTVV